MLRSSIATVIGPTPPGTGVIRPARSAAAGSTSPTIPLSVRVDADVHDGGAFLDVGGADEPAAAGGDDEHVRVARPSGEVGRARVADGDGGVALEQQVRDRLADDLAAADHDRVRALELDVVLVQEGQDPERRRGNVRRLAEVELAGVERVEAVDVLDRLDGADDAVLVDAVRERQLDEDAVDGVVVR